MARRLQRMAAMESNLSGPWHNQHHSVLHLVHEGRRIWGEFKPGVGPLADESFPIQGFVLGDQIGFVVAFGAGQAVTSWVGHIRRENGGLVFETLWQMAVRLTAKDAAEAWRGTWSGADAFRRGEPALERAAGAAADEPPGERLPSVPVRIT